MRGFLLQIRNIYCPILWRPKFPGWFIVCEREKKQTGSTSEGEVLPKAEEGLETQEWEDFYVGKFSNVKLWKSHFLISKALKCLNSAEN